MPVDAVPPADRRTDDTVRRFPATVRIAPPVDPVAAASVPAASVPAATVPAASVPAASGPADPGPATTAASRRRFAAPDLSVSGARDLVGRCLAGWGVAPEAIDDARLVVSELVTNAVRHDHAARIDVEVVDLQDRVTIVVEFDGTAGDGTARPQLPSGTATSGRGLSVVDGIAQRWGRVAVEGGGRVWAVLAAPRVGTSDGRPVDVPTPATSSPARAGHLLVRLAGALAVARTRVDVAVAVATETRRGLDALGVRVSVVERDRRHLTTLALVAAESVEAGVDRRDLLDESVPSAVVARTGRALHLATRGAIARAVPALLTDPVGTGVEALASLPLVVDGVTIGALTVAWDSPRELGPDERATLAAVASFASTALQRATLAEEQRATSEVLQATLLPQSLPDLPGVDLATVYRPLGHAPDVGGDWYDAFVLPGGNLYLVIGDVAGHGTLAARTMGKIRYSARAYATAGSGPAEVLARTNALLRHHGRDLLASMLCIEYDPVRRTAVVADAGHPPALAVPATGAARYLDGHIGPMLGATDDAHYEATTHLLAPRETVLLFTDGLVERRDTAIDDSLADLAVAASEMRRFRLTTERLAVSLADRRAASDVVTDDVCVLALSHR